jgi:hypothetical protein
MLDEGDMCMHGFLKGSDCHDALLVIEQTLCQSASTTEVQFLLLSILGCITTDDRNSSNQF